MEVIPGEMPVTTPVTASTVATETVLLLQTPPGVALLSVVVAPTQNGIVPPVMGAGGVCTVKGMVEMPDGPENVMMVVPAECPVTTADAPHTALTVATVGLLLLHQVPGPDVSTSLPSITVSPTHTPAGPTIVANEVMPEKTKRNRRVTCSIFFIIGLVGCLVIVKSESVACKNSFGETAGIPVQKVFIRLSKCSKVRANDTDFEKII